MADGFTFELVSPEKLLLSGEAEIVSVPATEGDMGVLANHSPVMTSLRPGMVEVTMVDGSQETFFVRGGFADVTPTQLTVLAEFAVAKKDMTRAIYDEQIAKAQELYDAHHKAGDDEKAANAQTILHQLQTLEGAILPA
ncbi:F0F1 ATP synthase subunit epsilon [Pseudahrensia aquimaris]|uniref:ATP synthase epsilon chain n=1 Tax=Pseudahrensia aquimaris TaxID=744461 RepID=A0ABW3FGF8_9HYPH